MPEGRVTSSNHHTSGWSSARQEHRVGTGLDELYSNTGGGYGDGFRGYNRWGCGYDAGDENGNGWSNPVPTYYHLDSED